MNCHPPSCTIKILKIDYCQYTKHRCSTRKVFSVCYFYALHVHLGGLLFMIFQVTENMKHCVSHFICSLISIYTYSSLWKLFMMSKQTKKVKKNDKLSHIGGWLMCVILHVNFTHIFRKKIYCYLNWVNCKPFIYPLWTTSINQL